MENPSPKLSARARELIRPEWNAMVDTLDKIGGTIYRD